MPDSSIMVGTVILYWSSAVLAEIETRAVDRTRENEYSQPVASQSLPAQRWWCSQQPPWSLDVCAHHRANHACGWCRLQRQHAPELTCLTHLRWAEVQMRRHPCATPGFCLPDAVYRFCRRFHLDRRLWWMEIIARQYGQHRIKPCKKVGVDHTCRLPAALSRQPLRSNARTSCTPAVK